MTRIPTRSALALVAASAVLLAGCSDDEPTDRTEPVVIDGPESPDDSTAPTDDPEGGESGDTTTDPVDPIGGDSSALRDGTWPVGRAGEVEFRVAGPDGLELVGVREAQGWRVTDREVERGQIDIDLQRGPTQYSFQAEIQRGFLQIEIDQDVDPAEPGPFDVGEAGSVEVAVEGGALTLSALDLAEGWTEASREDDGDEVQVTLRREGEGSVETWQLSADLDDGRLGVAMDYAVEGIFLG